MPEPAPRPRHDVHQSLTGRAIARLLRPAMAGLEGRLARLERRIAHELERTKLGVWRGGLDGFVALPDGGDNLVLSTRMRQELAFWRRAAKIPGAHPAIDGPFEEVFGRWQRARLEELGAFLSIDAARFAAWRRERSAVEIGGGPFPMIAASADAPWRWAVAVDPLADGFAAEGLVPERASHVPMVAACGEAVPLPGRCADVVVCENALDHVIDPARVLAEIRRLLSARGVLWLLVDVSAGADAMHPHPMSEERVRTLLAEQKFEVVRERSGEHASHPGAAGEIRVLARPGA